MEFLKISKFELGGPRRDWETTFFQMPLGVSLASRVNFREGGFSASPNLQASSPPRPPPPPPAAQARAGVRVVAVGAGGRPLWRGLEWEPRGEGKVQGGTP